MRQPWHYPQDIFELLVEAIACLCRSKRQMFDFFRGAAVPKRYFEDVERGWSSDPKSINKFGIAREVLKRLNEDDSDRALKARRDVIQRIISVEDYSACWPNQQAAAQGYVAQLRKRVGEHDAFARMDRERQRERQQRIAAQEKKAQADAGRRVQLSQARDELASVFSETDPQRRGRRLEHALNRVFEAAGISLHEAFTVTEAAGYVLEQIDGAIQLDGHVYLVEMKWHEEPIGVGDITQHISRVYHRGDARGVFISYSGYTRPAIETCRQALTQKVIVLVTLDEIVLALEHGSSLGEMLRNKAAAAITHKDPYLRAPDF